VFTPAGDLVTAFPSRAIVAADGTIHLLGNGFIDHCPEPPCVFTRCVLLASFTPDGVPLSWRYFEPSARASELQAEALAIGDRGQVAFTGKLAFLGQSEPSAFVVIAEPD
jgi:hypothetical protein